MIRMLLYTYTISYKSRSVVVSCCFNTSLIPQKSQKKKRENMLVPLISLSCCPRFSEGGGLGKKGRGPVVSAVNML